MGRNLPMYQYCEELKRKVQNNRDLEFFGECAEFRICLVSLDLIILEALEVCWSGKMIGAYMLQPEVILC